MISQKELKESLDYDPDTGLFKWKKSRRTDRIGKEAGTINGYGYPVIHYKGKVVKCHKLAWVWMYGETPGYIDHVNGIRHDNRIANLRIADDQRNSMNRGKAGANKSGVKGVYWCKTLKRWVGQISAHGKKIHVGCFPDLIGAELAVRKKRIELHGEFANHG